MNERQGRDPIEGIGILGKKLREWADYGSLDELTATLKTSDGPACIRVDEDRRVWFENLDITQIVERS